MQGPWVKYKQPTTTTTPTTAGPWVKHVATGTAATKRPAGASGSWAPTMQHPDSFGGPLGSVAREAILSGVEEAGVDLQSPIVGTVKNIGEGLRSIFPNAPNSPIPDIEAVKSLLAYPITEPIDIGRQIRKGIEERDADKAAGGVGRAAGYIGSLAIGRKAGPAAKSISKTVSSAIPEPRAVRLGRTTIDPATGLPHPPIVSTVVEVGGEIPKEGLLQFHKSVDGMAAGLGGKSNFNQMRNLQEAANEAFPDLKQAQLDRLRGAVNTPEKFNLVANDARNRVWREAVEPAIVGKVDVTPVGMEMVKAIPNSIRIQNPKKYTRMVKDIHQRFMNKTVSAHDLQSWAKEARAAIRSILVKNDFDMAAALEQPKGKMAAAYNDALRDTLYTHVQKTTGKDIRPALKRYGALSDMEQAGLKTPIPATFIESLFGSPAFPTTRGVMARTGVTLTKGWLGDMSKIRRAFDGYTLDSSKVTQRFKPDYFGAGAGNPGLQKGQLNLQEGIPPRLFGIEQTPYRWKPEMRATSTLQDLQIMKREIDDYLNSQQPPTDIRRQWSKDAADIQREIFRRQSARKQ